MTTMTEIAAPLIQAVERVARLNPGAITGHSRDKRVQLARGAIAVILHDCAGMSYPEAARAVGRRSHSTVIYATQQARPRIVATVAELEAVAARLEHERAVERYEQTHG